MTESLRESIERIREVAPVLNEATDEAQAVVARIERYLNECSIGIAAHAQFSDEDLSEDLSRQRRLSYVRVDGKFRIAVTTSLCLEIRESGLPKNKFMDDEENPPVSWGSCPRDIKLESFVALPRLLDLIGRLASDLSQKANETTETVTQILKAVDDK